MDLPGVSIVIPTLNSARTLKGCLGSIADQDYPRDRIEIIVADGGSTDRTLEIARGFTRTVFSNPLKTGEAGKAIGVKKSSMELVAFIDSDNILPSRDWLRRMVRPFQDPDILGSEPVEYTYRRGDRMVTRYSAMMGMNDPLCYFLGNYDRINIISGKWTGIPHTEKDAGDYLKVRFRYPRVPTIGANGFIIRRATLKVIGDYLFDVDIVLRALRNRPSSRIAKTKVGIVHLFSGSVSVFLRKQSRRVADFRFHSRRGERDYRWNADPKRLAAFAVYTLTILPLFWQAFVGWTRRRDSAWLFHIPACWITLMVYSYGMLKPVKGCMIRDRWSQ